MSFEFTRIADITAIHPELGDDLAVENPNTVYVSVLVNDLQSLCAHLGADAIHLTDPDGNHLEIHQDGWLAATEKERR